MAERTGGSGTMSGESKTPAHPMKVAGKRMRLGELLIQAGLIDTESLNEALSLQKVQNKRIGQVLIDMGIVDDVELAQTLADQLHLKFARLKKPKITPEVIAKVPVEIAEKYSLIPIDIVKGQLVVAIANPLEYHAVDDIRFITQMAIYLVVSPLNDILAAIEDYYQKPDIQEDLDFGLDAPDDMEIIQETQPEEKADQDLMNLSNLPPVVRFTNGVIAEAIRQGASDIHIEPQKSKLLIRCRVDGIMRETMKTDRHVHASLVSRIKVISNLDISIRRKPQDGKAQVNYRDSKYDLRVSTIPTSYGEKVTIRILNPATAQMLPEDLGFSDADLDKIQTAIATPQGIVLVTGPTGSGKSSTLYACLNRLNTPLVNIITVEDPVEFDVEGINQVQINPKAGITFAAGLRSILRQDPDIVMLGEIRDTETAQIAFQAAQTGHLVLSTLHTNDAPSTVTRLLDLKIADFQLSAALLAVIGQRLVRRIHQGCKVPDNLNPQILKRIHTVVGEDENASFWKGGGCQDCLESGYTGRMGLYEILTVTPTLKEYIVPNVAAMTIKHAAQREGFLTMTQDGIQKALRGLTTIEEVFRVAPPEVEAGPATVREKAPKAPTVAPPADAMAATPPENDLGKLSPLAVAALRTESRSLEQKVLVVDDSEDIIVHLRRVLESKNYTVLSADNGEKAIELAESENPGLVVTDLRMPEMDGMTLIRELKSRNKTRHIPIILLTVDDELASEIEGINAGADDYIIKPLDTQRFLARVGRFFIQRKKILVVDDDKDMRLLLRRVLETDNYRVTLAENGKKALLMIEKEKPDLVITDYRMPEMDGIALIRALKAREATNRIPIIMVTVRDEVESEVEVIDAGAADYLTKPLSKKRLLIRVKRVFRMME